MGRSVLYTGETGEQGRTWGQPTTEQLGHYASAGADSGLLLRGLPLLDDDAGLLEPDGLLELDGLPDRDADEDEDELALCALLDAALFAFLSTSRLLVMWLTTYLPAFLRMSSVRTSGPELVFCSFSSMACVNCRERGGQTVLCERPHITGGAHDGVPVTRRTHLARRLLERLDVQLVLPLGQDVHNVLGQLQTSQPRARATRTRHMSHEHETP